VSDENAVTTTDVFDPNLRHPAWCDPQRCTSDQERYDYHWSAWVRVDGPLRGDPTVDIAVRTPIDQPPAEWSPTLVVRLTRTDTALSVEEYEIDPPQYTALVDAFAGFHPVMTTAPGGAA
jgi:hypothetical protein